MGIVTLGIDLAKNIFALHEVDEAGKPVLVKPKVARAKLAETVARLPPCLIGMEACTGAHHWARVFRQFGHTVKLRAPKFVATYRLGGKRGENDAADAAAWVGLVPGQYSSGGKARLGRITKAGDAYLRSLLVMGARAVLAGLGEKQDRFSRWARSLLERRGYWKAAIAIAAKNLRLAWAMLTYGEEFQAPAEAV